MTDNKTALVISAHAADFVWRCGGAIALHQELGYNVTVVCLSFGERGESARLWKEGKSLDEVKSIRKAEAEGSAEGAIGVAVDSLRSAAVAFGSGLGACSGGGKRRNQTTITMKLSTVARMRFLFWSSIARLVRPN